MRRSHLHPSPGITHTSDFWPFSWHIPDGPFKIEFLPPGKTQFTGTKKREQG